MVIVKNITTLLINLCCYLFMTTCNVTNKTTLVQSNFTYVKVTGSLFEEFAQLALYITLHHLLC